MQAKLSRCAACVVAWSGTGVGWVALAQSAPTLGDRERLVVGPYLKPVNEPQVSHLGTSHSNRFIIIWQTGNIPSGSATESPRNVEYIAPEYNPSTGEFDWNVTGLDAFPMPLFSQKARDPAVVALIEGANDTQFVGAIDLLTGTNPDTLVVQAPGGTQFSDDVDHQARFEDPVPRYQRLGWKDGFGVRDTVYLLAINADNTAQEPDQVIFRSAIEHG